MSVNLPFRIVRFSPVGSHRELLPKFVECYQKVFATEPWYEWKLCPRCKKYWGIERGVELEKGGLFHCGVQVEDFWSRNRVEKDIRHEVHQDSSCWIALDRPRVIGFCWGYPVTTADLEKKLGIALDGHLVRHFENVQTVAYQDEIGVLFEYRKRGLARQMFQNRLSDFLSQGLNVGVVRTREHPEPSVTFSWFTSQLGYKIIARYPDNDGRVILAGNLNHVRSLLGKEKPQ